jgi:hypothetical protein
VVEQRYMKLAYLGRRFCNVYPYSVKMGKFKVSRCRAPNEGQLDSNRARTRGSGIARIGLLVEFFDKRRQRRAVRMALELLKALRKTAQSVDGCERRSGGSWA